MNAAPFSLEGHLALVVGGTRGIGRAITLRFARAGAKVLATYVREESSAESLRLEAHAEDLDLDVLKADATLSKGLDALEATLDQAPALPVILVFAAATGVHKPLEELSVRHFDWTFHLNVRAFLELVRRLSPRLRSGSNILALCSEGAVHAMTHYTLVGASKGALESMVRHLAVELGPRGIRVNTLSPGAVKTEAWNAMPEADRRLNEATKKTPLGHLATPEEVAWAAQFLCSPAASGINGHTLVVDGGARVVG